MLIFLLVLYSPQDLLLLCSATFHLSQVLFFFNISIIGIESSTLVIIIGPFRLEWLAVISILNLEYTGRTIGDTWCSTGLAHIPILLEWKVSRRYPTGWLWLHEDVLVVLLSMKLLYLWKYHHFFYHSNSNLKFWSLFKTSTYFSLISQKWNSQECFHNNLNENFYCDLYALRLPWITGLYIF